MCVGNSRCQRGSNQKWDCLIHFEHVSNVFSYWTPSLFIWLVYAPATWQPRYIWTQSATSATYDTSCVFRCEIYHLNLVTSNTHMKCIVRVSCILHIISLEYVYKISSKWTSRTSKERIKYQYYWKQMMQNKQWRISLRHSMSNEYDVRALYVDQSKDYFKQLLFTLSCYGNLTSFHVILSVLC